MKKIIILSFVLILFSSTTNAQCSLPYKPFTNFSNDTTAFLNYNFGIRSNCYIGRTIENLFSDNSIKIKSYVPIGLDDRYDLYNEIIFYVYDSRTLNNQVISGAGFKNAIGVGFDIPISAEALDKLKDETDRMAWTPSMYLHLKDTRISNISVLKSPSLGIYKNVNKRITFAAW